MVTHWVEMIENELQEDQDNEVASIVDTYDISIDNIEQLQHPAVDLQAKWELKNIFVENLELPNYLKDFIIGVQLSNCLSGIIGTSTISPISNWSNCPISPIANTDYYRMGSLL
ncbi:unnamed protein product [Rhizophagus irregularis]|nr:unnamed protein product [Rhizophagus irregularis]